MQPESLLWSFTQAAASGLFTYCIGLVMQSHLLVMLLVVGLGLLTVVAGTLACWEACHVVFYPQSRWWFYLLVGRLLVVC